MTATNTHALVVRQRLPAPPADVFAAWTDAEQVREWMHVAPGPCRAVEMDVRLGGRFRFVMVGEDGGDVEVTGEYVEVDAPRRLAFTWKFAGAPGDPSLVTVSLAAAGESETDMVLTHERLPGAEATKGHEAGWITIAAKLSKHLAAH